MSGVEIWVFVQLQISWSWSLIINQWENQQNQYENISHKKLRGKVVVGLELVRFLFTFKILIMGKNIYLNLSLHNFGQWLFL